MSYWAPHIYREEGRKVGISDDVLEAALAQAGVVQRRGLPAILTLKHLATHVDVDYGYLASVISRKLNPYRIFRIAKRSGGRRTIAAPEPAIRRVQQWISKNVLAKVQPHARSLAYSPGSSPIKCAEQHCRCRWLIKIDIESFFESISEIDAYGVFESLGYSPLISFQLARICTRESDWEAPRYQNYRWVAFGVRHLLQRRYQSYERSHIGHLPQGAPTSPMLANLAVSELDTRLEAIAVSHKLVYTRYSDDLAFSATDEDFSRLESIKVIREVHDQLRSFGFSPNRAKAVVAPPGSRRIVLGLLVDSTKPRLSKSFKDTIRQHLHYLETLGWGAHATRRRFDSIFGMRQHIRGLIQYASEVDPEFGGKAREQFDRIPWMEAAPVL